MVGPSVVTGVLLVALVHGEAVEMLPFAEAVEVVDDDFVTAEFHLKLGSCARLDFAVGALV